MSYDDMSDKEINKLVAQFFGLKISEERIAMFESCLFGDTDGSLFIQREDGAFYCVNYCNDPSDYMPIVIKHGLVVVSDDAYEGHDEGESFWGANSRFGNHHHDIKYGRAAMICFLKMKESEAK